MTFELPTKETKLPNHEIMEEISELETPLKLIIEKIKDQIENGDYGLIIGDDASGRIPALILGNFIKKIQESHGQKKANIIFIPGKLLESTVKSEEKTLKLEDHLVKWGATKDDKILIITDNIKYGESLNVLVKLIISSGFRCEIATIGLEGPPSASFTRKSYLGETRIISGEYENSDEQNTHTPKIYQSSSSGVRKIIGEEKSIPLRHSDSGDLHELGYYDLKDQDARKDSMLLTQKLIQWYLNNE